MLSHICMKLGSKPPYDELHLKFDFCHSWLTFSWVIVLPSNSFSRLFLVMLSHIWMKLGSKLSYEELRVQIKFDFRHGWLTFSWVSHFLPFAQKMFCGLVLAILSHIWTKVGSKLPYDFKYNLCDTYIRTDMLATCLIPCPLRTPIVKLIFAD